MIVELDEFLKLFAKKYTFSNRGFPCVVLYGDGSGKIENIVTNKKFFEFDNLDELLAHLKNEEPKPSY